MQIFKGQQVIRYVVTFLLGVYFLLHALNPGEWIFLSYVNLIIHEAGHVFFLFFGDVLQALGGSIFQILIPATFVYYFWRKNERWSASLLLFWLGESILEVSQYILDAQKMNMDLLGGEAVIHDWNFILTNLSLLEYTDPIGNLFYTISILVTISAIILGVFTASGQNPRI